MTDPYTRLMSAVGQTLHAWSKVESGMWQLFGHVSGAGQQKAEAIFGVIGPFEIRVAVLDAAIACETDMTEEEKELWTSLSARLRKLHETRHEVVHFSVSTAADQANEICIAPFPTGGKERQKTDMYLTHDQIVVRANAFNAAAQGVGWFENLLQRRRPASLVDSPPLQEPELIVRIRESLTRTKAGQPPQPEVELE